MSNLQLLKDLSLSIENKQKTITSLLDTFKLLSDYAEVLMWHKDINHRFIFASKKLCEDVLEQKLDDVKGKKFSELKPCNKTCLYYYPNSKCSKELPLCELSDILTFEERKTTRVLEIFNINTEKELWIESRRTPIMNGTVTGSVGVGFIIPPFNREQYMKTVVKELENNEAFMITDTIFKLKGLQ